MTQNKNDLFKNEHQSHNNGCGARSLGTFCFTPMIAAAVVVGAVLPAQGQTLVYEDLTLTENVYDQLVILADDITVDCQGFHVIEPNPVDQLEQLDPVTGISGRAGIVIWFGRSDVTVTNCTIEDFWFGIRSRGGSGNTLIGNIVIENEQPSVGWTVRDAFRIEGGSGHTLIGNTEANTFGDGFAIITSNDNRLIDNIGGGPGWTFPMFSANGNELLSNTVVGPADGGGTGFHIDNSSDNVFTANEVFDLEYGFYIQNGSSDNTVRANLIKDNTTGISVCPALREASTLTPNRFRDNDTDIDEGGELCGSP